VIAKPKSTQAWRRQEARLDREGARAVPGSGNGDKKGDGKGVTYLVQAKTTKYAEFKLTLRDLVKTSAEAAQEDRQPVMQVQLRDEVRVAVIPWEDFEELLEASGRKL
jgi:hypothetical protein